MRAAMACRLRPRGFATSDSVPALNLTGITVCMYVIFNFPARWFFPGGLVGSWSIAFV